MLGRIAVSLTLLVAILIAETSVSSTCVLLNAPHQKIVRIPVLRDEAVLRDIKKAKQRVSTAVYYIDFFSTEFRRFYACYFTCSSGAAACD